MDGIRAVISANSAEKTVLTFIIVNLEHAPPYEFK